MEIPEKTPLPDVVVCFEIYYLINYTKLYEKYPEIKKYLNEKYGLDKNPEPVEPFRTALFSKVSPADLILEIGKQTKEVRAITELLYSRKELIERVQIRSEEDEVGSDRTCSVRENYKELAMCYTFVCSQNRSVSFTVSDTEKSPLSEPLFSIEFKQSLLNLIPSFYVTLVEPNSLPRGKLLKWVTFNTEHRSMKFNVHFYVFHLILLPPPFPSSCRNYSLDGFKSRVDMKDQCLDHTSMQELGVPFHTSLTAPDLTTSFSFVGYDRNKENPAYIQSLVRIVDECDQLTKQVDCDTKFYVTQRRSPEHIFQNKSQLVVDQIRQPNIRVQQIPKMGISECFILVGSVMGTWFAFSVYHDVPRMYKFSVHSWSIIRAYIVGHPLPIKSAKGNLTSSTKVHDQQQWLSKNPSRHRRSPNYTWYTGMGKPIQQKSYFRRL